MRCIVYLISACVAPCSALLLVHVPNLGQTTFSGKIIVPSTQDHSIALFSNRKRTADTSIYCSVIEVLV